MERITLEYLFKGIPTAFIQGPKDVQITGLTSNSKLVQPGNLFIAKKGLTTDGAKFIPGAVAAGARAILTDAYNPLYPDIAQIIHPNAADIEGLLAKEFYGTPEGKLFLVGITGTNGKTTTSYLVRHLLEKRGEKCGLIGTIEWIVNDKVSPSSKTTPDLLQNYKLFHEMVSAGLHACAMEVSSHALDQGRVQGIEFDVAVFTNLTQDHLDYHLTMEDYAAAKAKLFTSLKKGEKQSSKTAVINADCPYSQQIIAGCTENVIRYGILEPCDLQASSIDLSPSGMQFTLSFQGREQRMISPLIGRYNVYNLLAAAGVGLAKGFTLEEIAESFHSFFQVPGRLERVPNPKGLDIFVDYAHTDDALLNVLKTLQEIKKGRLITIFGCGGDRDRDKRPKMGAVATAFSDLAIVTSDNPRGEDPEEIIRQVLAGIENPGQVLVFVDRKEAIEKALSLARPSDIVLIAGKGHEKTQIFSDRTISFDDRAIAAHFFL